MGWFGFGGNNNQPKETDTATTENDGIVEINRLYDSEKSFRHAGDKLGSMIQEHHKREAIHQYHQENPDEVVTYDNKADRYKRWTGRWG